MKTPQIRALVFDVFGTVVDWRGSLIREGKALGARRHLDVDWTAFADAWRGGYQPAMQKVRTGQLPWMNIDQLHRLILDELLKQFDIRGLKEAEKDQFNRAWHRLDAWPDVTPGLTRLRTKFRIAPCSNGNISLMVDLARRNGFPWDAILGAELAADYKPMPGVYLASAAAFDCRPEETMMVAAHSSDLAAAAAAGLRTAFIARPDEHGTGKGESIATVPVDLSVASITALADRLVGT